MLVKRFVCFFLALVITGLLLAQTDTAPPATEGDDDDEQIAKPDPDPDSKLGIKMGFLMHGITGNENKNGTLAFGMTGGGYFRQKISAKTWLQLEGCVSFRGGNFRANTQEYESIRLLYADVPLMLMKSFGDINHKWLLGVQGSYLISPTMYLKGAQLPITGNLSFNRFDLLPVLGYQYHATFFDMQLTAKYGLLNINSGNAWPQNAKPINNNGTMHNIALEFNIIF